jgi:hypothetical protein
MQNALGILFLASFIEGLIKYVAGDKLDGTRFYIPLISVALGVTLAVIYKISVLAMFGIESHVPVADYVISGIIMGRGSNYVNDVIGFFRKNS